jgi:hypothetical protein
MLEGGATAVQADNDVVGAGIRAILGDLHAAIRPHRLALHLCWASESDKLVIF